MKTTGDRRTFFEFDAGADAFNEAFTSAMRQVQKRFVSNFIPPENIQRFHHGDGWRRPASVETTVGEMKVHSAVLNTPLNDITANDLGLLERSFAQISEAMQRQFAGMMYSTISEACDASGNTNPACFRGESDKFLIPSAASEYLITITNIQYASRAHNHSPAMKLNWLAPRAIRIDLRVNFSG
jgi:hypothetical protein